MIIVQTKYVFLIKVSKSQKHFSELSILPKKEWETEKNILRAVRIYFFLFGFFGRFENSKNCFQDLLTFNTKKIELKTYLVHQVYPEVNLSSRGSQTIKVSGVNRMDLGFFFSTSEKRFISRSDRTEDVARQWWPETATLCLIERDKVKQEQQAAGLSLTKQGVSEIQKIVDSQQQLQSLLSQNGILLKSIHLICR